MAYTKINFKNGETLLDETNLNHIEEGIYNSYATQLIALSEEEPETFENGDRYYNITENKIYLSKNNIWVDEGTPKSDKFYVELANKSNYIYDGETLISVGGGVSDFYDLNGEDYYLKLEDKNNIFIAKEKTTVHLYSNYSYTGGVYRPTYNYDYDKTIVVNKGSFMFYSDGYYEGNMFYSKHTLTILSPHTIVRYYAYSEMEGTMTPGGPVKENFEWEEESIGGGGSDEIYIGDEQPTQEDLKIWINPDEVTQPANSEVINDLSGEETDLAPSVAVVNSELSHVVWSTVGYKLLESENGEYTTTINLNNNVSLYDYIEVYYADFWNGGFKSARFDINKATKIILDLQRNIDGVVTTNVNATFNLEGNKLTLVKSNSYNVSSSGITDYIIRTDISLIRIYKILGYRHYNENNPIQPI